MKFETGQTSESTSANISIVSRSSKRGPTMLRSFAQHIQQCCAGARALHATYPHKYMRTRNQVSDDLSLDFLAPSQTALAQRGGILHFEFRGPFLESPEKPFVKLPTTCFGKPVF